MALPTQPHMALSIAGGAPGCSLLLFCCRTLAVAGDWWKGWFRMPFCFSFAAAHRQLREIGGRGGSGCPLLLFCCRSPAGIERTVPGFPKIPRCGSKTERRCIRAGPGVSLVSRADAGVQALGYCRAKTPVQGAASVPDEVRNAAARAFFSYTIKRRILFFLSRKKRMGVLKPRPSPRFPAPRTGRLTAPPRAGGIFYQASLPFSSGSTSSSDRMAHSIMLSSGSKVVKFCIHRPGAVRKWARALSLRPTQRLNS